MAKIFTADDLLKISQNNDKATSEVERIMGNLVNFADRGLTVAGVSVKKELRKAVVRKLENAGFKVKEKSDSLIVVSWRKSFTSDTCGTCDTCDNSAATPNNNKVEKNSEEKKSQTDCKATPPTSGIGSLVIKDCTFNVTTDIHHFTAKIEKSQSTHTRSYHTNKDDIE